MRLDASIGPTSYFFGSLGRHQRVYQYRIDYRQSGSRLSWQAEVWTVGETKTRHEGQLMVHHSEELTQLLSNALITALDERYRDR